MLRVEWERKVLLMLVSLPLVSKRCLLPLIMDLPLLVFQILLLLKFLDSQELEWVISKNQQQMDSQLTKFPIFLHQVDVLV